MSKLSYDVCRCLGVGCEERDTCLRYTDIPTEPFIRVSTTATMKLSNSESCLYIIKEENLK